MSGLNRQDMEILRQYAQSGNRELYWNYLAQKEGNDGYGLLALGVVRNDNVPGAVANIYAQNRARADGVNMSERRWEQFGADLMRADFAERERMMGQGRPDQALNLSVRQVQDVHDRTFRAYGISEDAWTPRMLLDAARRHGGEREAESVWRGMLDNSYLGIGRGIGTSYNAAYRYNDAQFNAAEYLGNVTAARALATQSLPNTDPNRIGASSVYHMYSERDRSWSLVSTAGAAMGGMPVIVPERDPARIAELNDARAVRLQRRDMRDDFHDNDPYRQIRRSPQTLAENEHAPSDPRVPGHRGYAMYQQIEQGVGRLQGGDPERNERLAMSLYAAAVERGISGTVQIAANQGRDQGGATVFLVNGSDPYNPASPRVGINLADAAGQPVADSLRRVQDAEQQQFAAARAPDQTLVAAREGGLRSM